MGATLHIERMPPDQLAFIRESALKDTIYLARMVLGFDKSEVLWEDEDGIERGETLQGDQYGISYLSPHKRMAGLLDGPSLKKHMEAPRGSYKTTLIQCWLVRLILNDRSIRIFYAMATEDEAKKTLQAVRELLQHPMLVALFGEFNPSRGQKAFNVSGRTDPTKLRDPTFQIGAVDMERTGAHCDVLVVDDIVTKKKCRTPAGFKEIKDYWDSLQHFPVGGAIILENGTRYADQDLHSIFLERPLCDEFETVVLGCGHEVVQGADGILRLEKIPGKEDELWPFMSTEYLSYKLKATDMAEFSKQYCNICLPSGMAHFRREQFKLCHWEPWMSEMAGYVLLDVAVGEDAANDFNVVMVVGLDATRRLYVFDVWAEKCLASKAADKAIELWQHWSTKMCINAVFIEDQTLSQMFMQLIDEKIRQAQIRMSLTGVKLGNSPKAKEARIEGFAGRFQQHRVLFCTDTMSRAYEEFGPQLLFDPIGYIDPQTNAALPGGELVSQFVRYPSWTWRDIPDCMSIIDARDSKGGWIAHGAGVRQANRMADMKSRAGRYFAKQVVNGVETLVEVAQADHASGHYERLARHIGMR